LGIEPGNDRGWLLLGISYRRRGNLEGAIECFQEALRLNSSMEEVWGLLAITYLDKGQEKEAENCLSNGVLKNPTSEELKFYAQNLIRIYKAFGPFF
jgi:tetratricopeptide (TPR) repeat protein